MKSMKYYRNFLKNYKECLHVKKINIKKITLSTFALFFGVSAIGLELSPEDPRNNANPGDCFAEVFKPAEYENYQERVLASPERVVEESIKNVEADRFETKIVVVRPAQRYKKINPAEYKTVSERVLVSAASRKEQLIPAQYEEKTERVLVRAAEKKWVKGDTGIGDDNAMCLKEIPAEYQNVTKKVMVQPAQTKYLDIQPQYKMVQKQVVIKPACFTWVDDPGLTKTVQVRIPGREVAGIKKRIIPAEYKMLTKRRLVREAEKTWSKILCKRNSTSAAIQQVQNALNAKNFSSPTSGNLDRSTYQAIDLFQKENNLHTGALTYETLNALGLNI